MTKLRYTFEVELEEATAIEALSEWVERWRQRTWRQLHMKIDPLKRKGVQIDDILLAAFTTLESEINERGRAFDEWYGRSPYSHRTECARAWNAGATTSANSSMLTQFFQNYYLKQEGRNRGLQERAFRAGWEWQLARVNPRAVPVQNPNKTVPTP